MEFNERNIEREAEFHAMDLYRACKDTLALLPLIKCQTPYLQDSADQHVAKIIGIINEIEKHELDGSGKPIHVSDGDWRKHFIREGYDESHCKLCGEIMSRPAQQKNKKPAKKVKA